jgi:hypothetical protein
MDELVRQIERSLKVRRFRVVFEDELQHWWPIERIKAADREKQIEAFAESHGWIVSILDADSGAVRAIFEDPNRVN